jgi:hypothetical protein
MGEEEKRIDDIATLVRDALKESPVVTRRELADRLRDYESSVKRRFVPRFLVLLFVCVFVPLIGSLCLLRLGAPQWICTPMILLSFVGAPFWAWRGDVMYKTIIISHQVVCPLCGKPLLGFTGQLALTTGRCGGCGEVIVADDTDGILKVATECDDSPLWDNELDRPRL